MQLLPSRVRAEAPRSVDGRLTHKRPKKPATDYHAINEFIKMATIFVENTYDITLDERMATASEEFSD